MKELVSYRALSLRANDITFELGHYDTDTDWLLQFKGPSLSA